MRPSRRRLTEQGADLAARNERLIAERDAALEEARAAKHAAKTAACLFKETDEKYVAACRELAAVRRVEESLARQIHEMAQPVEPSDEEVDAAQLRLELDAERSRADHLQKELDNALGLPPGGPLSSALWQPGYEAPTPDKAVSP